MSCNRSETKLSRTGRLTAGITALGSKAGSMTGRLVSDLARANDAASAKVGRRVAPVSNRVLKSIDRPTTVAANLLPALATAAVYSQLKVRTTGPRQGRRPAVAVAVGLRELPDLMNRAKVLGQVKQGLGVAALAGGVSASVAADLSEQPGSQRKLVQRKQRFLLGEQKVEVAFTKSKLTGWLNNRDLLLTPGNVTLSQGDMVHYGASTWHRGTTVLKTAQGEQTISHLRRLGLPSTSHYFERSLSDEEVATLVSGQRPAHTLPGHVGTIGAMENLAPSWAGVKRSLILTRLHWPGGEPPGAGWRQEQPATVTLKPPPAKTKREKVNA